MSEGPPDWGSSGEISTFTSSGTVFRIPTGRAVTGRPSSVPSNGITEKVTSSPVACSG